MRKRTPRHHRPFRYLYLRFVRLRGSAEEVARGMAMGVFIGMSPTMGLQMPIALFVAMLLRENKLAAILGVWVTNPLTAIPIYTFNFQVGQYLLGTPELKMPKLDALSEVMALGHDFLLPLTLGCFAVGLVSAAVTYLLTLKVYRAIKAEREKLARKREERRRARENEAKG